MLVRIFAFIKVQISGWVPDVQYALTSTHACEFVWPDEFHTVLSPLVAIAQQGNKAVFKTSTSLAASPAWIDASAFCPSGGGTSTCGVSGSDVCSMIIAALGSIPLTGGVIDARGVVPPGPGLNQVCSANPFPSSTYPPVTVLLPASTIVMPSTSGTWTLPGNIRLVGEGSMTILIDATGNNCCSMAGSMIQMGPPLASGVCPLVASGVSVEHLKLQGSGTTGATYGGIDNECAQASSYVNDVGMTNIQGIGLEVGPGASNSGPYSNVSSTAHTGQNCNGGMSSCVVLSAQTQGLHGVTCLGDDTTGNSSTYAGIQVNASNNTLRDIHVEAFWDGIEVGDTAQNVGNIVISNVFVSPSQGSCIHGKVTNAIHICGPNPNSISGFGACSSAATGMVTDVTISGASNGGGVPMTSVEDDVTGTSIAGCTSAGCATPVTSALYALGRATGGGYSRFATNPANPTLFSSSTVVSTWGVGTVNPSTSPCYTPGALYSYTAAGSGLPSIEVCTFSTSSSTGFAWK
jgi:hypothetical protein